MIVDNNLWHNCCPLCRSSCIAKAGEITYHGNVVFSSVAITITKKPELWRCKSCRSAFVQNCVPEQATSKIYELGISGDRWSNRSIESSKTKNIVRYLDRIFIKGAKVLDIGCNTGELLDYAKSRGCITHGIEYSKTSIAEIVKKGHVPIGDIESVSGKYDVITLFDVAEHMYDLPYFFQRCKNLINENGKIIVFTGDIDCFSSKISKSEWWYVKYPEHIVFPSKKYLSKLPGLKVEKIILTYAAADYKKNIFFAFIQLVARTLLRKYGGLPSVGPDHMMVILSHG